MRDDISAKRGFYIFPSNFLSSGEILNKYPFLPSLITIGYQPVSK